MIQRMGKISSFNAHFKVMNYEMIPINYVDTIHIWIFVKKYISSGHFQPSVHILWTVKRNVNNLMVTKKIFFVVLATERTQQFIELHPIEFKLMNWKGIK